MLRVTTEWSSPQGSPWYTTLHFDGVTGTQAGDAHSAVAALWVGLDGEISNSVSATVLEEVPQVDPATGNILAMNVETAVVVPGTSASDPLPWATQGLFRWRTGFFAAGREIRGRTFFPGVTLASNDDGSVAPATVSGLNTFLSTWLGGLNPGGELVVWSRTGGTATHVQTGTMWSEWAVLRSRRD